jgi:hypothetical protein
MQFFLRHSKVGYCYLEFIGNIVSVISKRQAMLDSTKVDAKKTPLTPPYVSFLTLKTLLKSFQEHGTPSRIDRSVLPNFSGAVAGQLIPALRFLGLIDSGNHSNDRLKEIVSAYGTDGWPNALNGILDNAYMPLAKIDLQTASPSQFDEAFGKAYPAPENVSRKCKTFYLAAAAEAKKPISPYIMRNKKPRSGPPKKRQSRSNDKPEVKRDHIIRERNDNPLPENTKLSQWLLEELDTNKMTEEEVNAVWALLKYFRKEGK